MDAIFGNLDLWSQGLTYTLMVFFFGGIIALVVSGVVAVASAVVLYLNRGSASLDEDDDGEDYDLDDLRDQ